MLSGVEAPRNKQKQGGGRIQAGLQDPPQPPHTPSRHGKEKAGTMKKQKALEMERMKTACLSYPNWDRYIVKKVD